MKAISSPIKNSYVAPAVAFSGIRVPGGEKLIKNYDNIVCFLDTQYGDLLKKAKSELGHNSFKTFVFDEASGALKVDTLTQKALGVLKDTLALPKGTFVASLDKLSKIFPENKRLQELLDKEFIKTFKSEKALKGDIKALRGAIAQAQKAFDDSGIATKGACPSCDEAARYTDQLLSKVFDGKYRASTKHSTGYLTLALGVLAGIKQKDKTLPESEPLSQISFTSFKESLTSAEKPQEKERAGVAPAKKNSFLTPKNAAFYIAASIALGALGKQLSCTNAYARVKDKFSNVLQKDLEVNYSELKAFFDRLGKSGFKSLANRCNDAVITSKNIRTKDGKVVLGKTDRFKNQQKFLVPFTVVKEVVLAPYRLAMTLAEPFIKSKTKADDLQKVAFMYQDYLKNAKGLGGEAFAKYYQNAIHKKAFI